MAYFCGAILSRIDPDTALKLYKDGCTDNEICAAFYVSEAAVSYWRRVNGLPPNPKRAKEKKVHEPYLADRKRCKQCEYQGNVAGTRFCNYYLETGKRRVYEGSYCKSFEKRRVE